MDFFSKVSGTISNKSKDVAHKAKELAEIANLNGQVSTQRAISTDITRKSASWFTMKESALAILTWMRNMHRWTQLMMRSSI